LRINCRSSAEQRIVGRCNADRQHQRIEVDVATVSRRLGLNFVEGQRTGIDVLVALALGARAVMIGRPVCWALAAEGARGVQLLLEMLRDEFIEAMTLAGASTVADIDRSLVVPRSAGGGLDGRSSAG